MSARRRNRNLSKADSEFIKYSKDYIKRVGDSYLQQLHKYHGIDVITTLAKRSTKYLDAHFFCDVCTYYMVTGDEMEIHKESYAHKRKLQLEHENDNMSKIQPPTSNHLSVLSQYLLEVLDEVQADDQDIQNRIQVVEGLERAIRLNPAIANVRLKLTGSVADGFALKDSDTNIGIVAQKDDNYLTVFKGIRNILLSQRRLYTDVVMDLKTRYPHISFTSPAASGTFSLRVIDGGKHHTNVILSAYSQWHPKVKQLGTLLKHCARQGDVTNMEKGGLLPMCMPILAIYFCQQFNGRLPVLFNDIDTEKATEEELENKVNYEMDILEKALSNRKSSNRYVKMCRKRYDKLDEVPIERLWLELLEYYSTKFNIEHMCVSIMEFQGVPKCDKPWLKSKRLTIEEPGSVNKNLCQGVSNQQVLDYVNDYIRAAYLHFAIFEDEEKEFSFTGGQKRRKDFPIFCRQCHAPGHLAPECPPKELPSCKHLHQLSATDKNLVTSLLLRIREKRQLTKEERVKRTELLGRLTHSIQSFYPRARPEIFGSTVNGFGSYLSDVDISVVFAGQDSMDHEEMQEVIQLLEEVIKADKKIKNVRSVLDSKVPIVRFHDSHTGVDGDISLYNCLAIRNSKLLERYSQVDKRVVTLGFCLKLLAKECKMADAYQRTLSSYAYLLMLIYYLQRCAPPVLPVLQELHDGETKPGMMVDGMNTWFFDGNNSQLRAKWPGYGRNKQAEYELWIGFLDFYSRQFDFCNNVVSVRQSQNLAKIEKMWNSDKLAIEDPFNTRHNLGIALNRESNARILSNIIIARNIFGSPMEDTSEKNSFEYFFQNEKYQQQAV